MWDLIVSVPDHCLSFYFSKWCASTANPAEAMFLVILLSNGA